MGTPPALQNNGFSVSKIWDAAPHNAFTDMCRFQDRWYCVFREGKTHAGTVGKIRVLVSTDAVTWEDGGLIAERGVDLRDPKLSITSDNRLMLLMGGSRIKKGLYVDRQNRVSFSTDGGRWESLRPILDNGDWLWRLDWYQGRGYGVSYRLKNSRIWELYLFTTPDGINYEALGKLPVKGKPNETTLRFSDSGTLYALVRREGGDALGYWGTSKSPYRAWSFSSLGIRLGGPNFIFLNHGEPLIGSRILRKPRGKPIEARMVLGTLELGVFVPRWELPSGGDCSYPGMATWGGKLYISYYSSHEGKASIYIAQREF